MRSNRPSSDAERRYAFGFWLVLAGLTAVRLTVAAQVGLSADEAHYLMYARRLAWGYVDHPPAIAFLIRATTFAGESPFFVRLGGILCSALSFVLFRRLALLFFGRARLAFWGLVLVHLMPYTHALSISAVPDAPLNMFWCGALLSFALAVRRGAWRWWFLTGLCFGGALLSKYHAALLPVCFLGYMGCSRAARVWLRRPQPYVAAALGLLVFLPNVLWNAAHGWVSYAFQLSHGGGSGQFDVWKVLNVLGGQLLAASPLVPILFACALITVARGRPVREAHGYLLWCCLPVFAFFGIIGLVGKILPHWPFVGWWSGSLFLAHVCVTQTERAHRARTRWRGACLAGSILGLAMSVFMYVAVAWPVLEPLHNGARRLSLRLHRVWPGLRPLPAFDPKYDLSNDLYGWDQAAACVNRALADMPDQARTFVFCHRFYSTSQLNVFLWPGTQVTSLRKGMSQYRLWFDAQTHQGWDALFVDEGHVTRGVARYQALFERIDPVPAPVRISRRGRPARDLRIYRCYGFRGRYEN